MARHRDTGDGWWPPDLAVFRASDWPPAAGDLDAGGPPWAAGHSVLAAHRRWCKARLAALPKGSAEYGVEQLRGMREAVAMTRNPPQRGER